MQKKLIQKLTPTLLLCPLLLANPIQAEEAKTIQTTSTSTQTQVTPAPVTAPIVTPAATPAVETSKAAPAAKAPLSTPLAFEPFAGKVVRSKVRLRTLPNRESTIVREIESGDMLAVVGEENDFYVVQPPRSIKGYVFRTFVLDKVVEGDKVNIRLQPDIDSAVIGRLKSGDKIEGVVSASNNKWLEIAIPSKVRFFVAKEYISKEGPVELVAKMESRYDEAMHKLNAVFHFARAEVQKSFEDISFDGISAKFEALLQEFGDLEDVSEKAREANALIEETYLQKKIAFLESKSEKIVAAKDMEIDQLQKLTQWGKDLKNNSPQVGTLGEAASSVLGQGSVASAPAIMEKNLVWQSLEDSLYHLWAASNEGKSMEDFYKEASQEAIFLTGTIESYTRPVKNRPGDYLLRNEANQPVGYLYSTKVNLQEAIGKKVTVVTTARPNNNFAFPAYFVLSVE